MKTGTSRIGAWALALVGTAGAVSAQAANTFRDPEPVVFRAFPEADSFRSIVRDVDRKARADVERRLPFKVHFNELGPHTLYVAFRGRKPVGLVYLRSEESQWGVADIGWSLSLDLRVRGFWFQRGRNRHRIDLERSRLAREIVGSDFDQLSALLNDSDVLVETVPEDGVELARTVLRSAMKTIAVTHACWDSQIVKLQDLAMGLEAFPGAVRFRRQVVVFDGTDGRAEHLRAVHIMWGRGRGHANLGAVVRTESIVEQRDLTLRWVLTPQLDVLRLVPAQSWADVRLRLACGELEGSNLLRPGREESPLRGIADELVVTLTDLKTPGAPR